VFLGSFFYFAHWMTQLVKEHRVQSVALLGALQRLQDEVGRRGEAPAPAPAANGHHPESERLVVTARGSMAHRPDCVVVAGKAGVKPVQSDAGLAPCKLCEPY